MALVDSIKGREVPNPDKGPSGNIPTDSPAGAGINNVPLSSRIIGGAKDVNPLGSPSGRHYNPPVITKSDTTISTNDSLAGDKGLVNTTTPEVPKYKDFTANGEKA